MNLVTQSTRTMPGMDGRELVEFASETGRWWKANLPEGHKYVVHNEFHGDHDLDWVLQLDAESKEVKRWSAKYLTYITWETR